jgi:hypothetical protein
MESNHQLNWNITLSDAVLLHLLLYTVIMNEQEEGGRSRCQLGPKGLPSVADN